DCAAAQRRPARSPSPCHPTQTRNSGQPIPAYGDLVKGICQFTIEFVRQKLAERDRKIERLETQVETLLALMGQKSVATKDSGGLVPFLFSRSRRIRTCTLTLAAGRPL